MIRLVWSEVRYARGRALALGAGMMVAAIAFCLLTASVDVGAAQITGVVGNNFRGAYDLLVLPAGSAQSAGTGQHLVQVNYLSAAPGGITFAQAARIAHLPGVGVAAPLAVVGYVLETVDIPIDLSSVAGNSGAVVFSVTSHFTADQGLSKYPEQDDGYVYVTPDRLDPPDLGANVKVIGPVEQLPSGHTVVVCPQPAGQQDAGASSPFQPDADASLGNSCYSRSGGSSSGPVQGLVEWSFPVLIAGVDPAAENALTGLDHAVAAGHPLGEGEQARGLGDGDLVIPVLASTTSFDGDTDHVTVGQLPPSAVGVARSGDSPAAISKALETTTATPVLQVSVTGQQAWQRLLSNLGETVTSKLFYGPQLVSTYWTAGPAALHPGVDGQLSPAAVTNPDSVWRASIDINGLAYVDAPPDAADTSFRSLTEHSSLAGNSGGFHAFIETVGSFNPELLRGFSGGGPGSPLASYRAPLLTGADAPSRAALGNSSLEPDGNMAGYAQQPPLLLTTLGGASILDDPQHFSETGTAGAAPIGSIRIRVSGLHGSVQQQLQKIAAVGQEIGKATGLQVIVTAGASPQAVTIALPAGAFGRPALQVSEQWTSIMVALVILQQTDRESLALFVLILVVCALFLAEAALAGVRGRRTEVGVLRAVGWGRRQVFAMVLGEVGLLGVLAGLAGAALSAVLIATLHLGLPLWRAVLVLPVAAVLAVVSGLVPAWLAARAEPAAALAPAARGPRRRGREVRSIIGLALTGVARVPGRCVLAAAGLAVGVAGLAVLLAAQASFNSSIGESALAGVVTSTTRGTDLVSALLAVGLGAAAVADVTYLNLRERAGEFAALEASGWGRAQIGLLLAAEAFITALLGAVVGAAVGLAAAAAAFGLSWPVIAGAAAAGAGGTVIALAGTVAVLVLTSDRPLAAVLAADA